MKVGILTDFPQRFEGLKEVYIKGQAWQVEGARLQGRSAILKLAGCEDRTAVEGMRGQLVEVPVEEAVLLGEGEYYHYQILGLQVWTSQGELLGRVREILSAPSNDIYVVSHDGKELLLPAIEEVVLEVDLEGGRMVVELLPGLA